MKWKKPTLGLPREASYQRDSLLSEPIHERSEQPLVTKGAIDVPMLLITTALILFGCVMIYSASSVYAEQYHDDNTYFIARHLGFLLMAIGFAAVVVAFCTPKLWYDFGPVLFGISLILLLLVLVIGSDLGSGAKRWIDLKVITIQPSEIAKIGLVMMLARFLSDNERRIFAPGLFGTSFRYGVFWPAVMIGVTGLLIAAERHISGLMIIGMLGVALMFLGGTDMRWLAGFFGVVAVAGVVLILVSPYAQSRVLTWWDIDSADPLGEAWQTLQGLMAIGSGGLFGTGLGNSRQKFGYVSQPQNDFIFTIICEELGFIGAALTIALFALFLWRGFYIAKHAPDKCSALIVFGLTFKVALQVVLNIAVVTNSMPNTGIALPFFSYGGTALMLQVFEVGIILSISRYCTHKKI